MYEPTTFDDPPNSSDATFSHGFDLLGSHGHGHSVSSSRSNVHQGHHAHFQDGLSHAEWVEVVIAARRFAVLDPICRQIIRLYTGHALGNGVTVQAQSERGKVAVEQFLSDPTNQRHLSSTGQQKSSDRLGIDGNWYVALHEVLSKPKRPNKVQIRRLDTLQIDEHITNPQDQDDVWFYLRVTHTKDFKTVKRLYPDISKRGTDLQDLKIVDPLDSTGETLISFIDDAKRSKTNLVKDVWVYHASVNSTGERGNPLITTSMVWSKQFRTFMESRIALQQARTQLVREEIIKGGAAAVQARQQFLQSSISSTQPRETNPANIPGGAAIHNDGFTLKNIEQKTAAQDAKIDGDLLLQMAGVSASVFPQYFGTESQRLATQRSIESPMMKAFKSFQKTLEDTFEVIIQFVFEVEGVPADQRVVDIDFPEIVDKARPEQMEMLKKLLELFPQFAQSEEVQSFGLGLVGLNNPDQIIDKVGEAEKEPIPASETDEGGLLELRAALNKFSERGLGSTTLQDIEAIGQAEDDWETAMGEE